MLEGETLIIIAQIYSFILVKVSKLKGLGVEAILSHSHTVVDHDLCNLQQIHDV